MMNGAPQVRANRGGRPRREEVDQRMFNLLDAAAEIFIRDGYAGTSIDRIAARAKVGKPTIYAHFGSKTGLLKAVVGHVLKHRTLSIDSPIVSQTAVGALKERLANCIATALEPAYVGLFRLYLYEGPRFPELFEAFALKGDAHQLLVDEIGKHEEFRVLWPRKDEVATILVSLSGMLVTTSAVQPGYRETLSPQVEASRFVDICLYGFLGQKADASAPS
jgi:AcrR family transcriptional regulator